MALELAVEDVLFPKAEFCAGKFAVRDLFHPNKTTGTRDVFETDILSARRNLSWSNGLPFDLRHFIQWLCLPFRPYSGFCHPSIASSSSKSFAISASIFFSRLRIVLGGSYFTSSWTISL